MDTESSAQPAAKAPAEGVRERPTYEGGDHYQSIYPSIYPYVYLYIEIYLSIDGHREQRPSGGEGAGRGRKREAHLGEDIYQSIYSYYLYLSILSIHTYMYLSI